MTSAPAPPDERRETSPPLRPVGRRPSLPEYVRRLWQRRHFIYTDSKSRAFSRHRDMLLGNLWLIGVPVLQALVYYIIFGLLLRTDRGIENFTGYLLIGIFLFRFTTGCVNSGISVVHSSRTLIRSFPFPRAAIPLSLVVREAISMGPVLGTLAVLLLVVPPGTDITWTWLLFPIIFVLHLGFAAGLVLYAARLGSAIPDLRHLSAFLTRFWFYTSGVFFAIDRFVQGGIWLGILQHNPMFIILDMSRDVLLYDTVPEARHWVLLTIWGVLTPALGFWYFWQGEESYGND